MTLQEVPQQGGWYEAYVAQCPWCWYLLLLTMPLDIRWVIEMHVAFNDISRNGITNIISNNNSSELCISFYQTPWKTKLECIQCLYSILSPLTIFVNYYLFYHRRSPYYVVDDDWITGNVCSFPSLTLYLQQLWLNHRQCMFFSVVDFVPPTTMMCWS